MTCEHCTAAAENPSHGGYQTQCEDCRIRYFARSSLYADCERENRILVGYANAMQRAFGDDWRPAHERVKAFRAAMKGANA